MSPAQRRIARGAALGLVGAGILVPVAAGLWQTTLTAFGMVPGLSQTGPSLRPWRELVALPGALESLRLSLVTGLSATLLALILSLGLVAALTTARRMRLARQMLAPILAAPHAATAIGLAFLIAPSGWIARLLSPWATGWQVPPDIATVHDRAGLALILGLLVKEVPFLALMALGALSQVPARQQIASARALGMARAEAWARVVLPQVYARIRLPVFVTLAFSLSVVDMAIILGPSTPPTLAVAVTRWLQAPDVMRMMPGAAGALAQLGVMLLAMLIWVTGERALAAVGRALARRGARRSGTGFGLRVAGGLAVLLTVLGLLALMVLALWSVTWRWSFPNALPQQWSLRLWRDGAEGLASTAGATLEIALAATLVALILAIGWLQAEGPRARRLSTLLLLPLLIPQVSFLFGLDIAFLRTGLPEGWVAVVWGHVLYVLPYVMIVLAGPWRAFDRRLEATAAALGAGPVRRLIAVRLPVLLGPLTAAAAVGVAVSVAQYLPTLFLGAGRVATLTTEAVTLSSGPDRRIAAIYALMQAALPWLGFALALGLPALAFRNRRGLRGGVE